MNEISVLIGSCDKNEDIIEPFYKLYKKYWKHDYITYIATETKDFKYGISLKHTGSWTKRIRESLEEIDTDLVIFMLDDFFLRKSVDNKIIEDLAKDFKENIAVCNFERSYVESQVRFTIRANRSPYLCSCQPSLWNRKKLIELLAGDKSPHEWELQIIDSSYDFYINNGELVFDIGYCRENRDYWGIVKGKWATECIDLFKKEKTDVDFSKRGFCDLDLSIIIPYYKSLELTKRLLDRLVLQLTSKVEVILIDDGCNEKELDKYPIKVIHQENRGVSGARNKGIEASSGKNIVFCDSDDMVSENYVEKILEKIKNSVFDYCFFGWTGIGRINGNYIITGEPPKWNTSIWNCIYKRELIGNNRFDETLQIGEDEKFNLQVRKGKRENIPELLYTYYTEREDNITGRYIHKEITEKYNKVIKTGLLINQQEVGPIGGIEKFLYEFFKENKDNYDILFVYKEINEHQLARYRKLVRCIKFEGQNFICKKYINCRVLGNIADNVLATDGVYAQMIHADLSAMNWKYVRHSKTTHHISVSNIAKASILKQCPDLHCETIYNVLNQDKPRRVLNIVSTTRLSKEKGYDKMKVAARKLNEKNYPFNLTIFSTDKSNEEIDGVVFRPAIFNTVDYVANSDYTMYLPDTESYGYSIVESLDLGVPVIITDIPVLKELGFIDGVHGFIVKQDMSNIDEVLEKAYASNLKGFKYKKLDNNQQWIDFIGEPCKEEVYDNSGSMVIKAKIKYLDTVIGRNINIGEIVEVTKDRGELIISKGFAYEI